MWCVEFGGDILLYLFLCLIEIGVDCLEVKEFGLCGVDENELLYICWELLRDFEWDWYVGVDVILMLVGIFCCFGVIKEFFGKLFG